MRSEWKSIKIYKSSIYFQLNLHKNLFAEGWYSIIYLFYDDVMWCACVLTSFVFFVVLFLYMSHVYAFFFSNFPHKFVIITVILDDDNEFQYFITIKRDAELVMLLAINGTSNGIRWISLFLNDILIFCKLNASNHWNDEVRTYFFLPVQIQWKKKKW